MEYFLISNSTDKKEVGHYIQTKGLPDGYTSKWFDAPNSLTKLTNDDFPKQDPDLIFELEPKAKLTDIVSASNISARGLLMNEKTKNIFEQFNLPEHKFYPATLIVKSNKLQYYWLHIINNSLDDIDYQKTEFYLYSYSDGKLDTIEISSTEDYNNQWMNTDGVDRIKSDNIIIKYNSTLKNKDLLLFGELHNNILISKSMASILNSSNISGVDIINIRI